MTVRSRFFMLIFFLAVVFSVVLAVQKSNEKRIIARLFNQRTEETSQGFQHIIDLRGRSLQTLAFDYTFWDEMVEFLETVDVQWGEENIDASLSSFRVDAAWVYRLDGSFVYSASRFEDEILKELPFSADALVVLFAKSRFRHFFITTPHGLMEIRGATIHPTEDMERKTAPRGYFLVGTMWDAAYLDEISKLTRSTIAVTSLAQGPLSCIANLEKGTVSFVKTIPSWNGALLAYLNVRVDSSTIGEFNRALRQDFLLLVGCFITVLFVSLFAIMRWVNVPLHLISAALKSGHSQPIEPLRRIKTEFGDIARLIEAFFKQKDNLIREITERKQVEGVAAAQRQRYEDLVNNLPVGVYRNTPGPQGRFLEMNPAHVAMFEADSREECLKHNVSDFYRDPIRRKEVSEKIMAQGYIKSEELELVTLKGRLITVSVSAVMKKDADGEIYFDGIVEDITERKKSENQLKNAYQELKDAQDKLIQSEKMATLGQLAVGLAHEIKNPLTIITSAIDSIDRILVKVDSRGKDYVRMISQAADRANKVVKQLLMFSRSARLELNPVDLYEAIDVAVDLLSSKAQAKNIIVKKKYCTEPISVYADKILLEQVLVDIYDNAIDAVAAGGMIGFKTRVISDGTRRYAAIDIIDNGTGIASEDLYRIFDPFFTTKEAGYGTGLGLSIAYLILKNHSGTIEVKSKLGLGTRCTVSVLVYS